MCVRLYMLVCLQDEGLTLAITSQSAVCVRPCVCACVLEEATYVCYHYAALFHCASGKI